MLATFYERSKDPLDLYNIIHRHAQLLRPNQEPTAGKTLVIALDCVRVGGDPEDERGFIAMVTDDDLYNFDVIGAIEAINHGHNYSREGIHITGYRRLEIYPQYLIPYMPSP